MRRLQKPKSETLFMYHRRQKKVEIGAARCQCMEARGKRNEKNSVRW